MEETFKIKVEVDKSSLSKLSNDIQGAVGGSKKLSGFTNIAKGGSSKGSGAGGAAGAAALAGGVAGAVVAGVEILKSVLEGISNMLVKSSGFLQSVLGILGAAFQIFFKPFGDFLAILLMPLAMLLLKFAVWFMKTLGPPLLDLAKALTGMGDLSIGEAISNLWETIKEALGVPEGESFFVWVSNKLIEWVTSIDWVKLGEDFSNWLGAAFPIVIETLLGLIVGVATLAVAGLMALGEILLGILKNILEKCWDKIKDIGQWLYDQLTGFVSWGWDVLSGIGQWIKDKIIEAWEGIKNIGGKVGGAVTSTVGKVIDWGKNVLGIGDAVITPDGQVIKTDPNDYLFATKNPGSLSGGSGETINITVQGSVYGDLSQLAKDLADEIAFQRGTLMRF